MIPTAITLVFVTKHETLWNRTIFFRVWRHMIAEGSLKTLAIITASGLRPNELSTLVISFHLIVSFEHKHEQCVDSLWPIALLEFQD